jgi:beta-phosphoglucomutase
MRIKAVLFDIDGVLVDSEAYIAEAARQMFLRNYTVEVKEADFLPFVGTGEDRYLSGVAGKYGIALDIARDKALTYEIYGEIIQGKLQELPGAAAFVHKCRDHGLPVALATSADRIKMVSSLKEIGLPVHLFQATVNGLDVEHKKPAPDIYLSAAKLLDTDPAECLVVEDAINGVQAACAAGCTCLALTSSFSEEELREAGAHFVAANLKEALENPLPGLW